MGRSWCRRRLVDSAAAAYPQILSLGADIGDGGVGPISASRAAKQIGTGHPGFLRHSDSDDHFSLPDPRPAKKLRDRLFVYHTNFARADAVAAQTFTTIPTWEIAAGRQTGLPPRRVGRGKEVPHSNHPYPARRRGASTIELPRNQGLARATPASPADLGRVAIGLASMLLALYILVDTLAPSEIAPGARALFAAIPTIETSAFLLPRH